MRNARRRSWNLAVGAVLVGGVLAASLLSFVYVPYDPTAMSVGPRLAPPSPAHPLGTDPFGRDLLSRILVGARTTLWVGLFSVAIGMSVGLAMGAVAGLSGGWADEGIMRLIDALAAFPSLLMALMLVAVLGVGTTSATIAIGVATVPVFARLTRAGLLTLRESPMVEAARAAGASGVRLFLRHLVPNLLPVLLVEASLSFANAVLAEAALSYLGLGTQPPWPSWGRMLREAQSFMALSPYPAVAPGIAVACTVLGLNLLGDGLRDRTNPRRY